jgi:hypothetical protein
MDELARAWPPGGLLRFNLQNLRLALLRGEHPPSAEFLGWAPAMAFQPGGLRTICRNAIDRGERLDPAQVGGYGSAPAQGSLLGASVAAVFGAMASADGDHEAAANHWSAALRAALDHDYRLLVCDALEAFAGLASRRRSGQVAVPLLAAAEGLRAEIGYRFRFDFEQAAVDQARAESAGHPRAHSPGPATWQQAAELALGLAH